MAEQTGTLLDELRAKHKEHLDNLAGMVEARNKARGEFEKLKDPSDEQRSAFDAAEAAHVAEFDQRQAEVKTVERRMKEQKQVEKARRAAADVSKGGSIRVSEPATYREDNARDISYFRDLALADPRLAGHMQGNSAPALERLQRHAVDVGEWMTRRDVERERRSARQIEDAERSFARSFTTGAQYRGFDISPFEKRVNPNRTDGQGGYVEVPTVAA